MLLFIQSLENKQIMAGVLNCMSDKGDEYCALSGELQLAALEGHLTKPIDVGYISGGVEALDMLCTIAGTATYGPQPSWA